MSDRLLKYLTIIIFLAALLVWGGVGYLYLNQNLTPTGFWRDWLPEGQTGLAGSSKKPVPSISSEITISPSTQGLSYSPIKPMNENFQEFILEGFLVKVEEDAILIQAGKMQKLYRFTEPKIILLSKNYNLGSQVRVILQRKENDQLAAIEISLAK